MSEDQNELKITFWEHLDELRSTFIWVFCTIAVGVALCLFFFSPLLHLLLIPLENQPLILLGPLEGMETTLKICFWVGLVATSPLWLFFVAQFIAPAFTQKQRIAFVPFAAFSFIFSGAGILFAYWITLPLANQMLYAFNAEIGINLWSYNSYISYTFLLLLANALAFEITLLMFFCVHIGLFTPAYMQSKRKVMILVAFILGALLTPPDVFTQVMIALPLIGLYELALLYARLIQRKKHGSDRKFSRTNAPSSLN